MLVTFGPDQALHDWLRNELAWALEEGLKKQGSGGEASDLGTDSPAGSWATRDGHIPRLTSWHASVAKNTSHKAAIYFAAKSLEKTLLVNLDGDNLVGPEYLAAVAKTVLASKNSWHGKACTAVTCGVGSLTGRMAGPWISWPFAATTKSEEFGRQAKNEKKKSKSSLGVVDIVIENISFTTEFISNGISLKMLMILK